MRGIHWRVVAASGLGSVVFALGVWALGAVAAPSPAECSDPALCRPQQTRLTLEGYYRAVSLDLRGVAPTPEELEGIETEEDVLAEIDRWLVDRPFAERVARRHGELLWPNIENQTQLVSFRRALNRNRTTEIWSLSTQSQQVLYRGAAATCLDEPATFDAFGRPVARMVDGAMREGWVEVNPYWAPETTIRVCAFDAMTDRVSANGRDCAMGDGIGDAGCGCGPNLRWCAPFSEERAILQDMNRDVQERIVAHVLADEPYQELFTSRRAFVTGRTAHYWRHLTGVHQGITLEPVAVDVDRVPEVPYGDAIQEIELPEAHAGLLTSPVYLLRFQTNRARAARFYDAFLCSPFQPAEGGIEVGDEVAALQPDVQQRPGCNYCHAVLEPAAAHWGRWTEQGAGFLDPQIFPEYRSECADCAVGEEACSEDCRFHYLTRALSPEEQPYLGRLTAYQFLRDADRPNVEEGPSGLVREGLADGRFTSCSVRRTVSWLFGREANADEEAMLDELTAQFLDGDFSYPDLVRAIVTHETYRRAL
jgi:hypothetical protein